MKGSVDKRSDGFMIKSDVLYSFVKGLVEVECGFLNVLGEINLLSNGLRSDKQHLT